MNPSKDAYNYWQVVNRTMLAFDAKIGNIWKDEKIAVVESIEIVRDEGLRFLALERERIMRLSREEAISEVIRSSRIEYKLRVMQSARDNGLLEIG